MTDGGPAKDFLDAEEVKLRIEALEAWKGWATGMLESMAAVLDIDTEPEDSGTVAPSAGGDGS